MRNAELDEPGVRSLWRLVRFIEVKLDADAWGLLRGEKFFCFSHHVIPPPLNKCKQSLPFADNVNFVYILSDPLPGNHSHSIYLD